MKTIISGLAVVVRDIDFDCNYFTPKAFNHSNKCGFIIWLFFWVNSFANKMTNAYLFDFVQDLKDYMRQAGEVTYADAHKQRRNEG